jgi:hypothetical protein
MRHLPYLPVHSLSLSLIIVNRSIIAVAARLLPVTFHRHLIDFFRLIPDHPLNFDK